MTDRETSFANNGGDWRLALRRVPATVEHRKGEPVARTQRRPVLIVPGYGMNSFIFDFHPRGLSLVAYLASRGLEVWSADLRGQGRSEFVGRDAGARDDYGMGELAVDDVGTAIAHVLAHTETGGRTLDLIGCSLGASLVFAHLACVADVPVHTIVSMGGLVTWAKVPTFVRALFYSPRLAGMLHLKGTRTLAGRALPLLARWAPGILSMYLHTSSTDITDAATMIQTVEDPSPRMNREIAEWIGQRELVVRGVNVSRALATMKFPLLCIVAKQDGIVPPETASSPFEEIGSTDKELFEVGDETSPIAHADLFLSTGAQERIFARIAEFLIARE